MKKKLTIIHRIIVIIAMLTPLSWQFAQATGGSIEAAGLGPSKREALMAAQRNAVEQGIGVLVDSQSINKNKMLIEDKILTKSRGYIRNYTVTSETKQPHGNWRVVIQCQVAQGQLKDSLQALGILRDKMGNPRIMIVYDQTITGNTLPNNHPVITQAYEGIAEHLTEREFPVVAKRILDQSILQTFTSTKRPGKKNAPPSLKAKAEYLLVYTVKLGDQDSTGLFKKSWVMISAKILNTSTGRIIAIQNNKALGVDKDSLDFAYRKAARKAGKLAAQFLESKLVKRWQGDTVSGRPVLLEVVNINDFSLIIELKAQLKEVFGVRHISQRTSEPGIALYEITYLSDTQTLQERAYTILKQMGLKPGIPMSAGDHIRFELPARSRNRSRR